jgi:hypothetical protein
MTLGVVHRNTDGNSSFLGRLGIVGGDVTHMFPTHCFASQTRVQLWHVAFVNHINEALDDSINLCFELRGDESRTI